MSVLWGIISGDFLYPVGIGSEVGVGSVNDCVDIFLGISPTFIDIRRSLFQQGEILDGIEHFG